MNATTREIIVVSVVVVGMLALWFWPVGNSVLVYWPDMERERFMEKLRRMELHKEIVQQTLNRVHREVLDTIMGVPMEPNQAKAAEQVMKAAEQVMKAAEQKITKYAVAFNSKNPPLGTPPEGGFLTPAALPEGGFLTSAALPGDYEEGVIQYTRKIEEAALFDTMEAAIAAIFARGFNVGALTVYRGNGFGCPPLCFSYDAEREPSISIYEVEITGTSTRLVEVPMCYDNRFAVVLKWIEEGSDRSGRDYVRVNDQNTFATGTLEQATRFAGSREASVAIAKRALILGTVYDSVQMVGIKFEITEPSIRIVRRVA